MNSIFGKKLKILQFFGEQKNALKIGPKFCLKYLCPKVLCLKFLSPKFFGNNLSRSVFLLNAMKLFKNVSKYINSPNR